MNGITAVSAILVFAACVLSDLGTKMRTRDDILPKADGYRGIWYANQPSNDEFKYKYSGGMATYPQQHIPIAIYRKEVDKTYFCYGGTAVSGNRLLHMVSYFDHRTGTVPRPTILLNKQTSDAHDNPTMSIDDDGFVWVFSPSHGTSRPSYIHRSAKPYSIDAFERVVTTNFSYPQPWWVSGEGFLFLHTKYGRSANSSADRSLVSASSETGQDWSNPAGLAQIELGDYQISWADGKRVGTAFDYHPRQGGLNARSNIYYLETRDQGRSWRTAGGELLGTPIAAIENPARILDSRALKQLVYLKDLNFDSGRNPVILFLTSAGFESGPKNGPRLWRTIRWTGRNWKVGDHFTSDNNYDHGSLYIESGRTWRIIAPTEPGPQPYNPGGEMVMWVSGDEGVTWRKEKQLTRGSLRNHTYARRPLNAHPAFYAFWADGDARNPSESNLYFTDRSGAHVWRLPARMKEEVARPEIAW